MKLRYPLYFFILSVISYLSNENLIMWVNPTWKTILFLLFTGVVVLILEKLKIMDKVVPMIVGFIILIAGPIVLFNIK